jgi:NADH dehydrogenase FAD-containing subunit
MLESWLARHGARDHVELTFLTSESAYLGALGPRAGESIAYEFERRRIIGHRGVALAGVEPGMAVLASGGRLRFDLLVSFPPTVAAAAFPALPSNDRGFLLTDGPTRRVVGQPEIFGVGDAADFPLKQAYLALLQADAAAEQVSAAITGIATERVFEPATMCVVEQLDTATFVRAPLRATGRPGQPIEVAPHDDRYAVGTSPAWRFGKRLVAAYAPWRFRAGAAVHQGLSWRGLDAGIRLAARAAAD